MKRPAPRGLVRRELARRRRAEEELRRSEERYRDVIENANDIVYTHDLAGNFTSLNRAGERITGYTRAEALGLNLTQVVVPEYVELAREMIRRKLSGDAEGSTYELEIIAKDGRRVPLEVSSRLIRRDGEAVGVQGFGRDISERHQALEALRVSEERFRALVENSADAIVLVDGQGVVLYQSRSAERIVGYSAEERRGHNALELVHPDDRLSVAKKLGECRARPGEIVIAKFRGRRKDGTWLHLEGTAANRLDEPAVGAIVINYRDVTQRERAAEALRLSDERFRLVSRATNDAVWDLDLTTGAVWWSDSVQTLFGFGPAEVGRDAGWWADRVHPDDRERVLVSSQAALDEGAASWSAEFRFQRADDSYARVVDRAYILRDGEGHAVRMLGSMMDVTERRSLEEQLVQAQKMEAVGRLAGGIAHDFNNLLTAILGYGDLMLPKLHDPTLRGKMQEIRKAAERASALTRQLLAFSRKQVLVPEVVPVGGLIEELSKMLRRLIGEDIELAIVLPPTAAAVRADPGQLEQVLMNLAVNARDAMPRGGKLTITVGVVQSDDAFRKDHPDVPAGPQVVISVTDTGVGMDAEVRKHIFEPFFTTKELGRGTGLGLATVYGIVKQSGGHVEVDTAPGAGTTFRIFLRAVDPPRPMPPPSLDEVVGGSETVLLVEDEAALRSLAQEILRDQGYKVIAAGSGTEALELARAHKAPIDLLVTDVVMPGMDGRELADRLGPVHPETRCLFMSGYTDDAVVRRGVREEGMPFLQKPFTIDALALKVREVLDQTAPTR
ncbi:MAG TPA: PAS domain S-box protein [Vicinamibacteria bacterium]